MANEIEIPCLRELLRYEPETGRLFWRERGPEWFRNENVLAAERWNTRWAGAPALACINNGYATGRIFRKLYRAHRVAWALSYGEWPALDVDHINGDRADNRLHNLRLASRQENQRNMRRFSNNTSGVVGVRQFKRTGKWTARIKVDYREIHLGYFDTFKSAADARRDAERRFGFHPNHGREAAV